MNERTKEHREPPALREMKEIAGTLQPEPSARLLTCVAWVRRGLQLATDLSNALINLRHVDDVAALAWARAASSELAAAADTVEEHVDDVPAELAPAERKVAEQASVRLRDVLVGLDPHVQLEALELARAHVAGEDA